MRVSAVADSLGQRILDLTATIKQLVSSPALAVPHAKFVRDLQALKDETIRSATKEAEKTLLEERKAAYARLQGDVRNQADAQVRQHRQVWVGGSFLAGLAAAWMCAAYMQGGTKLAIWATGEPNGWEAGSHLMRSADPVGWNKLADLWTEVQKREAAARACKDDVLGTNAACGVPASKPVKPK
jgi:hypothetical protein